MSSIHIGLYDDAAYDGPLSFLIKTMRALFTAR